MLEDFRKNMRIVLRTWSGKIGVALLLIQIILALYVIAAYYPDQVKGYETQKGTYYPYLYPSNVPPCWAVDNKFERKTLTLENGLYSKQEVNAFPEDIAYMSKDLYDLLSRQYAPLLQTGLYKLVYVNYTGYFTVDSTALPESIRLLLLVNVPSNLTTLDMPLASLFMYIERPDGYVVRVIYVSQLVTGNDSDRKLIYGVEKQDENGQVIYYPDSLANYKNYEVANVLHNSLVELYTIYYGNETLPKTLDTRIIVGMVENGTLQGFPGEYKVKIGIYAMVAADKVDEVLNRTDIEMMELRLESNCYGFFGTDVYARPLSLGLLYGLPYAFLIGFTVTFISTFIGAIYGTIAGYWKDIKGEIMMRVADVMLSLPFLPILIAISFSFGTITLGTLVLLMIVLSWAGPVVVIRSMALQISEQLYIEAAKATGVPTWKIIFNYIFPQIYPYTMAIVVLSIPGIIIAEASLALLGFGDPMAPTWGKMLQLAYNVRAVTAGWWWLYIFPGLALVVFSATFLLLGRAIEPIVAPKLQK